MGVFSPLLLLLLRWDGGSSLHFGQVTVATVLRGALSKRAAAKKKSPLHTPAPWAGRRSFFSLRQVVDHFFAFWAGAARAAWACFYYPGACL